MKNNKATLEFTKEELLILIDGIDCISEGAVFANYNIPYEVISKKLNDVFYKLDWTK